MPASSFFRGKEGDKAKIDKWHVDELAYFLEKLDSVDEGGSTMLDNSLVFYTSSMSDGDQHDQENKPSLVAGSAGGAFKTGGNHVDYGGQPMPNLYITMLNALGVPVTTFGTAGKARLPGLI